MCLLGHIYKWILCGSLNLPQGTSCWNRQAGLGLAVMGPAGPAAAAHGHVGGAGLVLTLHSAAPKLQGALLMGTL